MEQSNSGDGASLNELQAIEQAVDTLRNQISNLKKENVFLKNDNQYLLATLQEKTILLNTIREQVDDDCCLNAENDFIAKERDAFQSQVIELESICQQQKTTIEELQLLLSKSQVPIGLNAIIGSLKEKLGLDNTSIQN